LKKVRFTPKPPKGGLINISKSISPWGFRGKKIEEDFFNTPPGG
jgi:hypothetical protein